MAQTISIGAQSFEFIREKNCFLVDKTGLIREWWENADAVTLITRPRRFGKTLNLDMLNCFFSTKYEGRGDLFEGLSVWKDEAYHKLQGSYPVISLSFANIKDTSFTEVKKGLCQIIRMLYNEYDFLLDSGILNEDEKQQYQSISVDMEEYLAVSALNRLSNYLMRYYGRKVIILLDEYDTPMQEAYVHGFWEELVRFFRKLFHAAFKTNPYLERAMLTGITRVSKESIFSDLNNLEVVTSTSEKYADCFGFTEEEVFGALDEFGMGDKKEEVKQWYDGFCFGSQRDIYNPWSITNCLDKRKIGIYWALEDYHLRVAGSRQMPASSHLARCSRENTSSNSLVSKLIREGNAELKMDMEALLDKAIIETAIDEEIVFNQLDDNDTAIWSLLLASGYLKVEYAPEYGVGGIYGLSLTNYEVERMFRRMIQDWFGKSAAKYNDFVKALFLNDLRYMNRFMNQMTGAVFSYFDTGKQPSEQEPERFYHGFVLGLIADSKIDYVITSNRESGFGRYDVVMEPRDKTKDAYVFEFKVYDPDQEKTLEDTVESAKAQIEEKAYDAALMARGIPGERIRHYGFAFAGKQVLIG
ncbi:MAG: AAA family ATPase [Lachnospiraceae bacterium]|nr:AAA family ATPase [Lachnospiraceae bacterium]MCI9148984.1 AAA family ATPase [Lachnospiraceae bacterium]